MPLLKEALPTINNLLKLKENILATLAYFDMFDYPLTYSEVFLFLENKYTQADFSEAVDMLLSSKLIFHFDRFYTLKNDYHIVIRRNRGNQKASEMIAKARAVGELLIKFPYVRGVGISGSLSKNFADDRSDIDLFIITAKNRLWIARTLMHCFKKLTFLVNRQHHYCMNYYIDEQQLTIAEKNIYTAIEVATLIPLQGDVVFENFYAANSWIGKYLPNKCMRLSSAKSTKTNVFKRIAESLFNNSVGNRLDNLLMRVTAKRWGDKTAMRKLNMRGIVMGMSAAKHHAKPDPVNFQHKLIEKYKAKVSRLLMESTGSSA